MGEPQSDKQGLKLSSGSGKAVRDQDVQENWGVDSFDPATIPVPGEKGLNLYDYIVKKEGRKPSFFGRYLTHRQKTAELTSKEAKFLLDLECRILLFHAAGMWFGAVRKVGAEGITSGRLAAQTAIAAATKLSVPDSVYIYANIEPEWEPTTDWMLGWWKAFGDSAYEGSGFYCGASAFKPFTKAVETANQQFDERTRKQRPVLWFTQPSSNPTSGAMPRPADNPFAVQGWQYGFSRGKPNFQYDVNVATDNALTRMWSL